MSVSSSGKVEFGGVLGGVLGLLTTEVMGDDQPEKMLPQDDQLELGCVKVVDLADEPELELEGLLLALEEIEELALDGLLPELTGYVPVEDELPEELAELKLGVP